MQLGRREDVGAGESVAVPRWVAPLFALWLVYLVGGAAWLGWLDVLTGWLCRR